MQWPGGRILQRHELDAFLAQAVSSQLYEPDQLQELKVRCSPPRQNQTASMHEWKDSIYSLVSFLFSC